jgi:hypothetical protein
MGITNSPAMLSTLPIRSLVKQHDVQWALLFERLPQTPFEFATFFDYRMSGVIGFNLLFCMHLFYMVIIGIYSFNTK